MSDWFSLAAAAIPAAVSYFSNKNAVDTAKEGLDQQNQLNEGGRQRGIAAVRSSGGEARGYLDELRGYSSGGGDYLRRVMARSPAELDPDQRIMLDDVTRDANASVASSGMRGAGRAGVAVVNDARNRTRARMFAENRARSDAAGRGLEGRFAQANTSLSNVAQNEGRMVANTELNAASQQGQNAANAGMIEASGDLANGRVVGDTIGQLGSIFAQEEKERSKDPYASGVTQRA